MRTLDRGLPPSAYKAYMASAAWVAQKERWRARHPRRRRCAVCRDRHYDLHHRTYVRSGRERMRDLVPLCHRHHQALHRLQHRMHWTVERASRVYLVGAGLRVGVRSLLTTPPGWTLTAVLLVLLLR